MKDITKNIIRSVLLFTVTFITYWLGGGDFSRGTGLASAFIISMISISGSTLIYYIDKDKK